MLCHSTVKTHYILLSFVIRIRTEGENELRIENNIHGTPATTQQRKRAKKKGKGTEMV